MNWRKVAGWAILGALGVAFLCAAAHDIGWLATAKVLAAVAVIVALIFTAVWLLAGGE
jgi:hypothetical protein